MKAKTKERLTVSIAVLIMYTMVLCILFGFIRGVKSFNKVWIGRPFVQSSPAYKLDEKTKKLMRAKFLDERDYVPVGYIKVTTLKASLKEQAAARIALSKAKEMGANNVLLISLSCRTESQTQGVGVGSSVGGYSKSRTELVRTYVYTFVALKRR